MIQRTYIITNLEDTDEYILSVLDEDKQQVNRTRCITHINALQTIIKRQTSIDLGKVFKVNDNVNTE